VTGPPQAGPEAPAVPGGTRPRRTLLRDGLALAGLVLCIMAAERFSSAASTLDGMRVADSDVDVGVTWPEWFWPLVLLPAGLLLAWYVRHRLLQETETLRDEVGGTHDLMVLRYASIGSILVWGLWQVGGMVVFWEWDALPGGLMAATHVLAIVLAFVALGGAGYAVGDVSGGWERASAVRVQLLLLAVVGAVFFVIPITAAQVSDVFRAWGDPPVSRAATGLAGALLLGSVCRTSAVRLLLPTPQDKWGLGIGWLAALVVAVVVMVVLGWYRLWLLCGVVALGILLGFATRSEQPIAPPASQETGLRRLGGTLGVIPLALVFAALCGALTDSLLLPSPLTDADAGLLAATMPAALGLAVLAAYAHPREDRDPPDWPTSPAVFVAPIGVLCAALTFVAGAGGTAGDVASLALVVAAAVLASWILPEPGAPQFAGAGGAALGVVAAVFLEPVEAPRALGTIGVALLCLAGLVVLLHLAASAGARRAPKATWSWLPKRVPVVTLLAAWVLAAWLLTGKTVHQARTIDSDRKPGDIDTAVAGWLDREASGADEQVPMLLVAASGGGSKAAYWTDLVLDCVFGSGQPSADSGECEPPEEDRFGRLFLTSSVSGGSVGIHHLIRSRHPHENWVDAAAGSEVLSPVVAWGLLHDLPLFMAGARTDPRRCDEDASCLLHADRALVQESAVAGFEDGIVPPDGGGLIGATGDGLPVTVFNGALDGADGRVLLSPLSLAPPRPRNPACRTRSTGEPAAGSVDGHEVLNVHEVGKHSYVAAPPYQDVPLVTAAVLSARFPVVAPAARLGNTEPPEGSHGCDPPATLPSVHVRDGGYVENSGLLTITELLPAIAGAIEKWKSAAGRQDLDVPLVVVSIDDDPAVVDGNPELDATPRDNLGISKRAGPGYLTRLARDRLESCQYPNVHYERISPRPRIGARAATGWELSETARDEDLVAALGDPERGAGKVVARLRAALESGFGAGCPRG
jgi:hypothetical protein